MTKDCGKGASPDHVCEGAAEASASRTPMLTGATDALGHIVDLMIQSNAHRCLFLAELEWLLMPAILLQQFRLFRRDGRVVGYASWAFLSPEAEDHLAYGNHRLSTADWRSGDRPWLIEIIAPFGSAEQMMNELKKTVFTNMAFKMLQLSPNGSVSVVEVEQ